MKGLKRIYLPLPEFNKDFAEVELPEVDRGYSVGLQRGGGEGTPARSGGGRGACLGLAVASLGSDSGRSCK